jgi:membrane protease YdiL (CAAX protease family)
MKRFLLRVLRFPLTRMVIALAVVIVALIAAAIVQNMLGLIRPRAEGPLNPWLQLVGAAISIVFVDLSYRGYVRWVERRPADELSFRGAPGEFGRGALLGAALMTATIAVLAVLGCYHVEGTNPSIALLGAFVPSISAGYIEEVISRAIIFRITEEGLGSWLALVLSSLFFGFAHSWNPGATPLSSAAIALEAGVLLGVGYMLTRRLWFVVGLHFAWNFVQGGVFGAAVSGTDMPGLLKGVLTCNELLSGGKFGPEASLVTVALCPAAAVALTVLAVRRGNVVAPFWARRDTAKPAVIVADALADPALDVPPLPPGLERTVLEEDTWGIAPRHEDTEATEGMGEFLE